MMAYFGVILLHVHKKERFPAAEAPSIALLREAIYQFCCLLAE